MIESSVEEAGCMIRCAQPGLPETGCCARHRVNAGKPIGDQDAEESSLFSEH